MKRLVPFVLFLSVIVIGVVRGQQAPEQSLKALKMAPGLEAKLWASEPMMTNPTDLTVDERGRVWVLEGQNYRRKSRNLPDLRPEGDRIIIMEDTNQDGAADKVKVFDQNPDIRVPLGIAVLGDKVYVSQSPDIIVYTKDKDDNIIKKEVLLTGFSGIDHDHGLHAVVFGPDGKYYFNQGNTGFDITDKSGNHFQTQGTGANTRPTPGYYEGAVLRMDADGSHVEVLGQNFRNPYEVAVDSWGNVFQTDNDDDGNAWTRLLYNMEGGNYGFRGPGNRTWTEDRSTHWHQEVPGVAPLLYRIGAGSPCGLLVYEGKLLPPKYRGQLFHADAGKRLIAMYPRDVVGAGFAAGTEDVLNGGDDTWSRPSDVAVAPDGSVFVADWYDPGVGGHQMGDPEGARGRVYRIAPVGNKPAVPALNLTTNAGLTEAFSSPNSSRFFLAYTEIKAKGQGALGLLQGMWKQSDPILRARALWLLGGLGPQGAAALKEATVDKDPRVRVLSLRVARNNGANMLAFSKPLLKDPSPQVRREVMLMLRDPSPSLMLPPYQYPAQVQPTDEWLDAMAQLAAQYDGKDRWYLEAFNIAARGREEALYTKLKAQNAAKPNAAFGQLVWGMRPKNAMSDLLATVTRTSAPMADREVALDTLGWMPWPEAASALEAFIVDASTPAPLAERAFGLYTHQLFGQWMDSRKSPNLAAVLRKGFSMPGAQATAVSTADGLGDPQFLPDLLALAKLESAAPASRGIALEAVSATRDVKYLSEFQALAASGPTPLRVSAVKAVANLNQPSSVEWAQKIVQSDAPNEVRAEAMRLLGTSAAGLNLILDMAEKGTLGPELVGVARNLTNYAAPPSRGRGAGGPAAMRTARTTMPTDPAYVAIRERAGKLLPLPPASKIPTAFEIDLSYAGKPADGRKVFDAEAGCAACHSIGGPKKMGPDLSAIGAKYGKQAMLDNIINPSDAIGVEYMTVTVTLKNGDQLTGMVTGEAADNITLQIGAESPRRIPLADIASRQQVRVSPMPEGLLAGLSLQQVADLLEFLSTLK